MSTFDITKSVYITSDKDIDAKYRVVSLTERDLLITNKLIQIHHIIAFDSDATPSFPRGRYELKEYPTEGSLTGILWELVGNSTDKIYSTIGEAQLEILGSDRSGTTIKINESNRIVEYIWHPEDITDEGLVPKYELDITSSLTETVPGRIADATTIKVLNDTKLDNNLGSGAANRRLVVNSDGSISLAPELGIITGATLVDTGDADNKPDSIRFSLQGGGTLDININEFFDVGAFNLSSIHPTLDYVLRFNTLGGTTQDLNLTSWFDKKMNKSTSLTPSALSFQNELGNWVEVPQKEFKVAYVNSSSPGASPELENKIQPYADVTTALEAIRLVAENTTQDWTIQILDSATYTINQIPAIKITFSSKEAANLILLYHAGVGAMMVPMTVYGLGWRITSFDLPSGSVEFKRNDAGSVISGTSRMGFYFNCKTVKLSSLPGSIAIDISNSIGLDGFIGQLLISGGGIRITNYSDAALSAGDTSRNIEIGSFLEIDSLYNTSASTGDIMFSISSRIGFRTNIVKINNAFSSVTAGNILFSGGYSGARNTLFKIGNISNFILTSGVSNGTITFLNSTATNWKLGTFAATSGMIVEGVISTHVIEGAGSNLCTGSLLSNPGTYPSANWTWSVKILNFIHNNPPPDTSNMFLFSCYQGLKTNSDGTGDNFLDAQFINCPIAIFGSSRNSHGSGALLHTATESQLDDNKLVLQGQTIIDSEGPIISPYLNGSKRIEVRGNLTLGDRVTWDKSKIQIINKFKSVRDLEEQPLIPISIGAPVTHHELRPWVSFSDNSSFSDISSVNELHIVLPNYTSSPFYILMDLYYDDSIQVDKVLKFVNPSNWKIVNKTTPANDLINTGIPLFKVNAVGKKRLYTLAIRSRIIGGIVNCFITYENIEF